MERDEKTNGDRSREREEEDLRDPPAEAGQGLEAEPEALQPARPHKK